MLHPDDEGPEPTSPEPDETPTEPAKKVSKRPSASARGAKAAPKPDPAPSDETPEPDTDETFPEATSGTGDADEAAVESGGPAVIAPAVAVKRHRALPLILIVLSSLAALIAVFAIWANRQVMNTDHWTKSSSAMLENPAIRSQVSNFLVDSLYANVDVQGTLAKALPTQAKPLAGPAAGALRGVVEKETDKILQRPRVQSAWEQANRVAHEQFLKVIDGNGKFTTINGGNVTLNLKLLLFDAAQRVGLSGNLVNKIPNQAATITVIKSEELGKARQYLQLLQKLPFYMLGAFLLLSGAALAAASGWRREAVRAWGIGLVFAGLAALILKSLGGSTVVDALSSTASGQAAAQAVWDINTDLLNQAATATIAYGLVAVFGAWVAGPTAWAQGLRKAVAPYLGEPVYAWSAFVLVVLLVVWWGPTPAFRNPVTAGILILLLAAGYEALRRLTAREHPDARVDDALAVWRERFSSWADSGRASVDGLKDRYQREPAAAAVAPVPAPPAQAAAPAADAPSATGEDPRVDQLERLAKLKADGVLDDDEFKAEKARILGGRA